MAGCATLEPHSTPQAPSYSEVLHVVLVIILMMSLILLVAALVTVYVAFPHRGEEVPGAPWLGDAMNRVAEQDAVEIKQDEPETAIPVSRTPNEAHALETIRQIRAVIQSWDDMRLKSREAVEGIKHIIKEREE